MAGKWWNDRLYVRADLLGVAVVLLKLGAGYALFGWRGAAFAAALMLEVSWS